MNAADTLARRDAIRMIVLASSVGEAISGREIDDLVAVVAERIGGKEISVEAVLFEIESLMCERGRDEL